MKVSVSNFQRTIGQRKIGLSSGPIEKDCLRALTSLRLQRSELSIIFVGPRRSRELNRLYRGIDAPTDVLSFPIFNSTEEFPLDGDFLLGDIVINAQRAVIQAKERGVSLRDELRRLIVHGLVHLIGYDHDNEETYKRMRRKERSVLAALSPPRPVVNRVSQKRASS